MAAIAVSGLLWAVAPASGEVLLNETWSDYSSLPADPVAPWSLRFGGGASPETSSVKVVNATVNGATGNWALIDNSAVDEPVANPTLSATFASASHLNISLSYSIPENYGVSSQIQFSLGRIEGNGTASAALNIVLGRNWQNNGMSYDQGGTKLPTGHTFVAGETVTLSLTNIDQAAGTYNLLWSSSTGASGSVMQAGLSNLNVTNWNAIWFTDNSAVGSTSRIYIGPVSIVSIPEASAGLLATGGSLAMFLLGACRARGVGRKQNSHSLKA